MNPKKPPEPIIGRTGSGKASGSGADILRRLLATDPRLILASQLPPPGAPKRRRKKKGA